MRERSRVVHGAAAVLSLLLVSAAVLRVSDAAFTATTADQGNQFTAGSVVLADDDAGSAMFQVGAMAPGQVETRCIEVTYSGTLDGVVTLYGATTGGTELEDYLDLSVERGTGGAFGDCTGFVAAGAPVYQGTLDNFVANHASYSDGADSWAVVGGGADDVVTYRFTATLQDNNLAQAKSTTTTFTWEAQNT